MNTAGYFELGPPLVVEVDTLRDANGALKDWLQRIREEHVELVTKSSGLETHIETWSAAGDVDLLAYHADAWAAAVAQFVEGHLHRLAVNATRRDNPGEPVLRLLAERASPISPEAANRVQLLAVPDALDHTSSSLEGAWARLLKELARDLSACVGYATRDYVSDTTTPYEEAAGVLPQEFLTDCQRYVRGYFWANVLSSTHLGLLGGFERVESEAPCVIVEDLTGRGDLAYLQVTEALAEVTVNALGALRTFLEPVLRPRRPGFRYVGPTPLLVSEDLALVPIEAAAVAEPVPFGRLEPSLATEPILTFKHEDEDERGQAIGPAIVFDPATGEIDDRGWMTVGEAQRLASENGYRFSED